MSDVVELTVEDGIAHIRFRRPERLNALDLAMTTGFRAVVGKVVADPEVRVVVLSGEGRAFMAGGDLAYLKAATNRPRAARELIAPIHEALVALNASGLPVLAAIQGAVAGAGLSLALFADIVLAAEDARLNMAYLKVGAPTDCGGAWSLTRLVGPRKAMEIALLCEPMDAAQALALGLVNRVVANADLKAETHALAARIASGPPLATRLTRGLIAGATGRDFADHLAAELEAFVACAGTADFEEALDAFLGKRTPVFTGR
jgi:2-(1,2-epoxy-1,2-dihydrophenyl)acetyl-CoA isomerase